MRRARGARSRRRSRAQAARLPPRCRSARERGCVPPPPPAPALASPCSGSNAEPSGRRDTSRAPREAARENARPIPPSTRRDRNSPGGLPPRLRQPHLAIRETRTSAERLRGSRRDTSWSPSRRGRAGERAARRPRATRSRSRSAPDCRATAPRSASATQSVPAMSRAIPWGRRGCAAQRRPPARGRARRAMPRASAMPSVRLRRGRAPRARSAAARRTAPAAPRP